MLQRKVNNLCYRLDLQFIKYNDPIANMYLHDTEPLAILKLGFDRSYISWIVDGETSFLGDLAWHMDPELQNKFEGGGD